MVKSVFYRILDSLTGFGVETERSAKIKRIIDSDISMREADIASACSVSVSTLQRIFKCAYGKTVTEYKNHLLLLLIRSQRIRCTLKILSDVRVFFL